MRDVFPTPQRNDPISAGFLAKVAKNLRKLGGSRTGSHSCGQEGAESGLPPHIHWIVEILYVVNAAAGYYYVKPRYYTGTGGPEGWLTDADDNLYELDIGGTVGDGAAPETLAVGDRLMAWWHGQRGTFVADPATKPLIRFELTETLELGDEADAEIVTWDGAAYAKNGTEIVVKDFTANPGSWQGVSGYQGWCLLPKDNDDGKYEIVWMEMVARYIEFTLDEHMQEDEDNEGIGWHAIATVNRYWHIKDPGNKVVVSDVQELFTRARRFARGIAIWDERRKLYIIVECESKAGHLQIELANPIAANKSDGAFVYDWRGTQQDIQIPAANVTVRDEDNLFRRALTGARGLAVYDADEDRYHLFQCQSKAGWIWVTLTSAMDSQAQANANVVGYAGTQQDTQNPGTPIIVFGLPGISDSLQSGDKVVALFDNVNNKYWALAKPGTPMWARTQANWVKNAGDPYVSGKLVTDNPARTGTTVTGNAFNIYLPRVNDNDPNVVSGRNICFMYDNNGAAVALSDYADAIIGSVMFMARETVPTGWGKMDGTSNVTGGSSLDARDRFLLTKGTYFSTFGGVGGSNPHHHFISCITGMSTTGNIIVDNSDPPEFYAWAGDYGGDTPDQTYGYSPYPTWSSINMDGPEMAVSTDNQMPAYLVVDAIERLDNSSA